MSFDPTRTFNVQDIEKMLSKQSSTSVGTATFGESQEIMLTIKGYKELIRVSEGAEFSFGRYEHPEPHQLDLTAYGALESGISREHAKLYLTNGRLFIADMGSTNGTYVRGKMINPAEPTLVRNGDEILLGRMRMRVQF